MTITSWLKEAARELHNHHIESARLDAELILSHTIRQPRTYLHAHGDESLDSKHEDIANARLELRLDRTPVAYIVGHKEFYGRKFKTTPAALIPRPESETIITLLAESIPKIRERSADKLRLVDVGTGTGCLGITAKLEWPELDVTLTDTSVHALNLAKKNATLLRADVHFIKNDLLSGYGPTDVIIANLPYVDRSWEVSPDTHAEPTEALFAANSGLALIFRLLDQAVSLLRPDGSIFIESDPRQQERIIQHASQLGYRHDKTEGFVTVFSRP